MTMLHRYAAIAAAFALGAAPASAAEKRYGLTSFETIEVDADVAVVVTARAPVSAVATGTQDALDRLSVEAQDGKLVIKMRRYAGDDQRARGDRPVTVRVNAANLRGAIVAGAGSLEIDTLRGDRVDVGLRGPGRLVVGKIDADRLSVAMIGNGTMTLGGTAKRGEILLSGAGAVDAGALAIDNLTSDSEGAGDHRFRAVKSATITARGVGKTVVLGRPTCTVRNVGSGTVECGVER